MKTLINQPSSGLCVPFELINSPTTSIQEEKKGTLLPDSINHSKNFIQVLKGQYTIFKNCSSGKFKGVKMNESTAFILIFKCFIFYMLMSPIDTASVRFVRGVNKMSGYTVCIPV